MDALQRENEALREEVAMLERENRELRERDKESMALLEEAKQMLLETKIKWAKPRESYAREH